MFTIKQYLPLALLWLVVLPLSAAADGEVDLVGAWEPIKSPSDPHVVEMGKFAVAEYNNESRAGLTFVKVIGGEEQVVGGINFRLVVAATDSAGAIANYEALVFENPPVKFKKLISFKPVK